LRGLTDNKSDLISRQKHSRGSPERTTEVSLFLPAGSCELLQNWRVGRSLETTTTTSDGISGASAVEVDQFSSVVRRLTIMRLSFAVRYRSVQARRKEIKWGGGVVKKWKMGWGVFVTMWKMFFCKNSEKWGGCFCEKSGPFLNAECIM